MKERNAIGLVPEKNGIKNKEKMCAYPGDDQNKAWPSSKEFSKCEARSSAQPGVMQVKGRISGCRDMRLCGLSGRGVEGHLGHSPTMHPMLLWSCS